MTDTPGAIPCAIVMTTCESRTNAEAVAQALLAQSLAACVQIFPISSLYKWQGKIEQAEELMLFCKIKAGDYASVETVIRALHTYETPEIIEIAITNGAPAYLRWIAAVTR